MAVTAFQTLRQLPPDGPLRAAWGKAVADALRAMRLVSEDDRLEIRETATGTVVSVRTKTRRRRRKWEFAGVIPYTFPCQVLKPAGTYEDKPLEASVDCYPLGFTGVPMERESQHDRFMMATASMLGGTPDEGDYVIGDLMLLTVEYDDEED